MTWCYLPDTASPSVQAAADLTWVLALPSRALPPPATSSGKSTPEAPSSQDNAPDISTPRPSGTTSKPSTPGLGEASSTLYSPDILASRFPKRDREKGKATHGISGPTSSALSMSSDPTLDGVSSKTSRGTLPSALKPWSAPYSDWVSALRLAYSRRKKQARRTRGSGSSSWPTARASEQENRTTRSAPSHGKTHGEVLAGVAGDFMANWSTPAPMQTREGWTEAQIEAAREREKAKGQNGNGFGIGLAAQAGMWTTPQAHDVTMRGSGQLPTSKAGNACLARDATLWKTPDTPSGGRSLPPGTTLTGQTPDGRKLTVGLENQATMWGTPRGSDGEKGGPNMSFGAGGTPLPAQAANWPTATTRDHKGSAPGSVIRKDGKSRLDMLDFAAEQGFTPPAPLTWMPGEMSLHSTRMARQLFRLATSRLSPVTLRRLLKRGNYHKRRLNTVFVEWLMAWPPGHALCGCSATEFTLWQQHMRGALSVLPTASAAWIWEPPIETIAPEQLALFD